MKWLRSSLFKNNSDTFVFEENINVKVEHYDNSLKDIRDVVVSGKLTRGGQDKIYADLLIKGNFEMISGKTLKEVVVPFEIEEREEYVDKSVFAGEEVFDVNLMDMYIDLTPLVNELIILNIPITTSDEEELEMVSGNDWEVVSEESLTDVKEKKESPFAALNGLFEEQ
ncbi:YceD family protein [uncultured Gemella sp.]|uniref:YceD family protein n=1 Tax=uncultured Gemella sp. TaxID=254352 RepID=UPI0028D20BC6|nr:YceD family protein [uncultured Gemella sp.]